eukprot:SAG22_NODE_913_length_6527_cov_2.919726_8_plen_116_part_00
MIMPYEPPANISVMDDIHANGLSVMFSTKVGNTALLPFCCCACFAAFCLLSKGKVFLSLRSIMTLFSAKDTYFGGPNGYKSVITSRAKEEGFVKGQIAKFKGHPALLGWYLNDEV